MTHPAELQYRMELSPHVHSGITKDALMLKTFAFMCVPAVAAVFAMGMGALVHIALALGTALVCHVLIHLAELRRDQGTSYPTPTSPLVAGMIVGLSMPIAAPYYATAAVAALTMVVFKWLQGRVFGRKYINPAAASKVLLLVAFTLLAGLSEGLLFHPHHLRLDMWTAAGFERAIAFYDGRVGLPAVESLILWKDHGWIGGASGLAVLAAGIGAVLWLKLKWRIVLTLMVVMGALSVLMALITGGNVAGRLAFHLFTGSVIFMGFFMATEPQSTPLTEGGQYAFGAALGLGTFFLQQLNVLGGSILVLVALNLLTPQLDKIGMRRSYGHGGDR